MADHRKQDDDRIEALVRGRHTSEAEAAVRDYASRYAGQAQARTQAADWYRRLGQPVKALRVLKAEARLAADPDSPEGLEHLMLCRILNSLGASRYALRVLERLTAGKTPTGQHGIIGNVFLSNYRFAAALPFIEEALARAAPGSYGEQLLRISLADLRFALGDVDDAVALVAAIAAGRDETQLRFIAHTAHGEYLVRSGDPAGALAVLEKGGDYVRAADRSNDVAFWHKWRGAALVHLGRYTEARAALDEAWQILYQPQAKPEGWLEILYWRGLVEAATTPALDVPQSWIALACYPGGRHAYADAVATALDRRVIILGRGTAALTAYPPPEPAADGWRLDQVSGTTWRSGKLALDDSLVVRLGASVARAGPYGIPKLRLIEELWPDELFAFEALEIRLKNLMSEARDEDIAVVTEDGNIHWQPGAARPEVVYRPGEALEGLCFLAAFAGRPFARADIEAFFGIKRTKAGLLLKAWQDQGVARSASGGRYSYQSMPDRIRSIVDLQYSVDL